MQLDHEANEDGALILEALKGLEARYEHIYLYTRKPSCKNCRSQREPLSTDELNTLQNRLLEMQTCFLPSWKEQLTDLLESLGLNDSRKISQPKRLDTIKVISQLDHTLGQISTFLNSIVFIADDTFQIHAANDHGYGGLKQYRCRDMIDQVNQLIDYHIREIFNDMSHFVRSRSTDRQCSFHDEPNLARYKWFIKATARSIDATDDIIKRSEQSDFSFLQGNWKGHVDYLDWLLGRVIERIEFKNRLEGQRETTDEDRTGNGTSSSSEDDQEQDDSPDTEQSASESSDGHEHLGSDDANSASDNEDNQSVAGFSTSSSEDTSMGAKTTEIAKSALPLAKLGRILLRKLLNTPTGRSPFTIGPKMSSSDINSLNRNVTKHFIELTGLLGSLFIEYESRIEEMRVSMSENLHKIIFSLYFYLVPLNPNPDLPLSGNHPLTFFHTLREQFCLADRNLRSVLLSGTKVDV
ncbi:hypothetical protein PSTG_15298 [Puccinia striiformis f. sp. tritici PST-78]|uniref:Uncharacterized protein n=1 Tax=Puccinia striiformis f. sp. tritici PST-78 TaxID=1165861 RepID=A0A0L0UWZ7_9BASI|nr:hypothetical protein PSTG_15298 [Puccinia striiformis f. sp. tritici PST-78]